MPATWFLSLSVGNPGNWKLVKSGSERGEWKATVASVQDLAVSDPVKQSGFLSTR